MNSSDEQLAVEAILAANEGLSPQRQAQATEWLSKFMESNASWTIWRRLIEHTSPQIRFFAANALTQKIRLYWTTLDTQAQGELKDELLDFGCRLLDDTVFQLRISMSVAAIAVRTVDTVWFSFWQDMLGVFEKGFTGYTSSSSQVSSPGAPSTSFGMNPSLLGSKMAILQILSLLPGELESLTSGTEQVSSVQAALKSGIPWLLQMVQEVLKHNPEKETTKTSSFTRSGSAPPSLFHSPSSSPSRGFGSPTMGRASFLKRSVAPPNMGALKKAALEVLHFWVASSGLSSVCPSSGASLRTMIHSRSELLPLLFESVKQPRLSSEAGEILLLLFTRRSMGDGMAPTNGGLSSAFTSASRLTQTSLQTEDSTFISSVISQLLGLADCYREALQPFLKEKDMMSPYQLASEYEENAKLCKAIVLLFVGVGESNGSLLINASSSPLLREYLEMVLEMTAHPLLDIAELAMQFWNVLEYHICGNPDFAPLYEQLLKNTLNTCMFPLVGTDVGLDDDWQDSEELRQYNNVCESAVTTLRACYSVMGDQFLQPIQELVNMAGQNGSYDSNHWKSLALAYFATTAVNLHVPANAPLISQLFRIAFTLGVDLSQQTRTHQHKSPHNTNLDLGSFSQSAAGYSPASSSYTCSGEDSPHNTTGSGGDRLVSFHDLHFPPFLLVTIARFIGEYRMWIMQSDESLSLLESALFMSLEWSTAPNSELAFSASISFKDLCCTSANSIVPLLFALSERYATHYTHIRSEDRGTLAAALTSILRHLESVDEMVNALQYLWEPTMSALKGLLEHVDGESIPLGLEAAICAEFDVLSTFFTLNTVNQRSLLHASISCPSQFIEYGSATSTGVNQSGHPIVVALLHRSELLQILHSLCFMETSMRLYGVQEKVCGLYSSLMASCQESFQPLLIDTMEKLEDLFVKQNHPASLQAMAVAVNHFGNDANHLLSFSKMILSVSQAVYRSENQDNSDLYCAYFELCSSILSANPDILVQSNGAEVLNSLIRVCMQTTLLGDTTLMISGLALLDKLMFGRHVMDHDSWKQFVTSTVEQLGDVILEHLLKCAINTSHHKTLQVLAVVMHKLIQTHNPYAKLALTHIFSQDTLPGNLNFTPDEIERIVSIFLNLRSSIHFRQFLSDFINVANRRAEIGIFNSYDLQYDTSTAEPKNNQIPLHTSLSPSDRSPSLRASGVHQFSHSISVPHVI